MSSKGYTILGWLVWKVGSRKARRKLAANRGKLAAAAIAAVVVVGLALAAGDDDDE